MIDLDRARAISRTHAQDLMARANVMGVGVGESESGEITLVVMLSQKVPLSELSESDVVPQEIEGLKVELRVVGEIEAQAGGEKA